MKAGHRFGDWVAVRPIGVGGMGKVWLAQHAQTGVHGALKVLHGDHEPGDRDRFKREVEVLGHLEHPSIVRLLDASETDEDPWLVMEFVDGENLEDRLQRGQAMPLEQALSLFSGFADGLRTAHAKGIHHRDVKSENVVVSFDGSSGKLVDFGVALKKGASRLTSAGLVMGTFAYLPPEVVEGGERDPALGDIYALGMLLHEALIGALVFRGDPDEISARKKWMALMAAKLDSEALDPGPDFPDDLRAVVRAATDPDPDERLDSMADLADGLLALVAGQEPVAVTNRPARTRVEEPEPARRGGLSISPLMVLVAGLVGVGLMTCGSVGIGVLTTLLTIILLD